MNRAVNVGRLAVRQMEGVSNMNTLEQAEKLAKESHRDYKADKYLLRLFIAWLLVPVLVFLGFLGMYFMGLL